MPDFTQKFRSISFTTMKETFYSSFDPPRLPDFNVGLDATFVMEAFILAVIAYTISISTAKNVAVTYGYEVDNNQVKHANIERGRKMGR